MLYRFQLTYDEIIEKLDLKRIPSERTGSSLHPGIYEVADINQILKHILPNNVKVIITISDIRLKSSLDNIQTWIFTKKSFFCTILGFVQSISGDLGDINGFIQLILGSFQSDKLVNVTGIDEYHLKCDCINRSFVNGVREPILYSWALDKRPGHKT